MSDHVTKCTLDPIPDGGLKFEFEIQTSTIVERVGQNILSCSQVRHSSNFESV